MAILDYHVRVVVEAGDPNPHYYREIQTEVLDTTITDPSHPTATHRNFVIEHILENIPTVEMNTPSDLDLRVNVGNHIVNDDYSVTADSSDTKTIKMSILRKDSDGSLSVYAFEKTTGVYGSTPAGYTVEVDKVGGKEFQVVASGTVLTEA